MMFFRLAFALLFFGLAILQFRTLGRVVAANEDPAKQGIRTMLNVMRYVQLVLYPAIGWYAGGTIEAAVE